MAGGVGGGAEGGREETPMLACRCSTTDSERVSTNSKKHQGKSGGNPTCIRFKFLRRLECVVRISECIFERPLVIYFTLRITLKLYGI